MSISLLNKWHLFSWPRHRKARYFSLTHSTDLYAALTLPAKNKAKQKISNTSSVRPTHTHSYARRIFPASLLLPSTLCIIKLADVIHTQTLPHSPHFSLWTRTLCHTQMVWWWDNQGDKSQLNVRFASSLWKTATRDFENSNAASCSVC